MKDFIFDNGLKFIYKKSNSELSSICISLDAGAARDGEVDVYKRQRILHLKITQLYLK